MQEAAPVVNKGTRQHHKQIKHSLVAQASEGGDSNVKEIVNREIHNKEARSQVFIQLPTIAVCQL